MSIRGIAEVAIFTISSVFIRSLRYLISTEKMPKTARNDKSPCPNAWHGQKVSNTLKRKIVSFIQKYSQAQPSDLLLVLLLTPQALSSLESLLDT